MNGDRTIHTDNNYVQGTFDRKIALDNDYIHFFAPGDAIFDSIVSNALGSYRGTCAAIAFKANFEWTGFIFTWALQPDEVEILSKGLSTHLIDKYRGFMPIEQFQCAVSIQDDNLVSEADALKVFNGLMESDTIDKNKIQHLGKRAGVKSNMDIFVDIYPPEKWLEIVDDAYKKAGEMIRIKLADVKERGLNNIRDELLKNNGARKATSNYYLQSERLNDEEINKVIYECFSRSKILLDSVCYVRIINE